MIARDAEKRRDQFTLNAILINNFGVNQDYNVISIPGNHRI